MKPEEAKPFDDHASIERWKVWTRTLRVIPQFFSIIAEAGEVFIKQNATDHLAEMLAAAGEAGATKLAA